MSMFKPEAMQLATLYVLREDAAKASLVLASTGAFAPEIADGPADALPELPGTRFRELYGVAHTRLQKLVEYCGPALASLPASDFSPVSETQLVQVNALLGEAWAECSRHEEARRRALDEIAHYRALLKTLKAFAHLDVDFSLLRRQRHFLDLRLGTVPAEETARLRAALALAGYVLEIFSREAAQSHCLIAGPQDKQEDIQPLLSAAGWRTLGLPAEFTGHPEAVRIRLNAALADANSQYADLQKTFAQEQQARHGPLLAAAATLRNAAPYAEIGSLLRAHGGLAAVSGWVPKARVASLRSALQHALGARCLLMLRDPTADEGERVPSLSRQPRWLAPFARLVRNYGVPAYGEVDPTPLFALAFVALFGMMFGDVGHGAVIAAAGLFVPRLAFARPMLVSAGIASMAFGFLYGSLFGFEEFISPLWVAPLSDPTHMLKAALAAGSLLIFVAIAIGAYNSWSRGRTSEALFGVKGIAGAALYAGLILAGYRLINGEDIGAAAWLIGAALAATMIHFWRVHAGSPGERMLVAVVEAFEAVLSDIANTLSFLRLAAFSLNHVALAVAVLALAEGLSAGAHWLMIVFGNMFIIVLEGGIVAIQVMRLQYYEGFSRFYGGSGRAFRPLGLAQFETEQT